ncbi:MAG: ABC transporter permease [Candidatus Acidiferrum sp.]
MSFLRNFLAGLRSLFQKKQVDRELDEELRGFLEMAVEEKRKLGMSRSEALREVRLERGSLEVSKEVVASSGWESFVETRWRDVRYGVRMLRQNPGFTAVAILTLGLGIGANTAIFSLMDTVMLRLLPVQRPEELVQLAAETHGFGRSPRTTFTNPIWETIRDHQDVFPGALASGSAQFNLSPSGVAQNVRGIYVSGSYFPTLGVRSAAGRLLVPDDDKRGCPGTAVLGYGFWHDHFGGAPVVGATVPINGHPFEIVGVSAPGFFGTEVGSAFDVAVPICSEAIVEGKNSSLDQRSTWWFRIMARRNPEMSDAQLSARLAVLSPGIYAETVPTNWTPADQQKFLKWNLTTLPAGTGYSYLRRQYDLPLKALMVIAGFVLLLACTNIASLMLARAASRSREISVRLALGASRSRLVRQLLTESVLLSSAGALLGLLFAIWGSRLIVQAISTGQDRISLDLTLDSRVLLFTAGAAIFTGLLFGVLPAFRATRVSIIGAMKGDSSKNAVGDTKFRAGRWTVAAQLAISLVLVATAGLFVHSFANLITLDAGFDRDNVLLADVDLHNAGLTNVQIEAVRGGILQRIRALPGVTSASASIITPISGRMWDDFIVVDDKNAPTGDDRDVSMNFVSPDYFATLRQKIERGRDFDDHDTAQSAQVAIVNQALARKFYSGSDAVGKTFRRYATSTTLGDQYVIVGTTSDAKYETLRDDVPPTAYFPLTQIPRVLESATIEIRTAARPSTIAPLAEQVILGANKSAAIQFRTLAQQVDDSLTQERLLAALSGFFGVLALLLATIGFYGVLAYLLLQRQREIGIRMALGASRGAVLRLVMRDVAVLLLSGGLAGLAITWAATRFVQSLLFNLHARDAATFAMSATLLAVVALAASYLPTRRAMRVDPMVALRYE